MTLPFHAKLRTLRNILSSKMKYFPFIFIVITHPEISTHPDYN